MTPIAKLVLQRRAALVGRSLPKGAASIWGLALSGGGIRSATFCFGLLRALARNELLLRMDILSTVSGGGYIGSTLGRLFSRAASVADVEKIHAAIKDASSRWFAWWLRANGRYLIPRGAKDRTFAIALYFRNLVGIHFEFGMLVILLGTLLELIDLGGWYWVAHAGYSAPQQLFPAMRYVPQWMPVIAFLEPIVVFVGAVIAIAYWCVPWAMKPGVGNRIGIALMWIVVACAVVLSWHFFPYLSAIRTTVGETMRFTLALSAWFLLLAWWAAVPIASFTLWLSRSIQSATLRADAARTRLTKWLAYCFRSAAIIALVGLVDRAAWFIAFDTGTVGHVGVALGFVAAVLRVVFPKLTGLRSGGFSIGLLLPLGRILGYSLTFLLCAWWLSVIYGAGLGALFQQDGPHFGDAAKVVIAIGVPVLTYLILTGSNLAFLNLSSLHGFYRARLIRSYLGAANGVRLGRPQGLDAVERLPSPMPEVPKLVAVGDSETADDIMFSNYTPHANGGPVHIINMCINETRDPRGGLFNQDRRGLALRVASGGFVQVAQEGWKTLPPDNMTLGTWTAISGAAVSPGLGALTRGGISALAFFAGGRLGYWWKATISKASGRARPYAKSVGLISEAFGIFHGTQAANWFLTDGGHFENTGAYSLLAERAQVIVLADCGADPDFAFCDLENLVRKARIDLQAEIILQKPVDRPRSGPASSFLDALFGQRQRNRDQTDFGQTMALFGSLNELASDTTSACLAMARVKYSGNQGDEGFLILIKPNISSGLPVDLINFKAHNPAFPQETTADQFFSEAQWESYSQLGYFLGSQLTADFIAAVIANFENFFVPDERVPFGTQQRASREPGAAETPAATNRLPTRIASVAVRAGLGAGAAATLAVAAWQAIDSTRTSYAKRDSDELAALKEVTDRWSKVPPQSPSAPDTSAIRVVAVGELSAAILRNADTLCPRRGADWFQRSPIAGKAYDIALQECGNLPASSRPGACSMLLEAANPDLQGPYRHCLVKDKGASPVQLAPRYWVYDYSDDALVANAHPCDGIAARRREAQRKYNVEASVLTSEANRTEVIGNAEIGAQCVQVASAAERSKDKPH